MTEHSDTTGIDRRGFVRGLLTAAALAGGGTSVTAATSAASEDGYTTTDRTITSWDGTRIRAREFEPDGEGPFPAVLMTHGWGGDRTSSRITRVADRYASNGYVVLAYDSRGFGESDGEVGVDGPKEVRDARHLITWLANREYVRSDGDDPAVAMDGVSYAGGIQLNTAAEDDRLDAIVPRWAWHDLAYALAPDGVVKAGWDSLLYGTGATGARGLSSGDGRPSGEDARNGLPPALHEAYLTATATNELPDDFRTYLKLRSPTLDAGQVDAPALLIQGWNDTLFLPNEAIWNADALGGESRLLFIMGGHTLGTTPDADTQDRIDEWAFDWIRKHVEGADVGAFPPVRYVEPQSTDDGDWTWARTDALPTAEGGVTLSAGDVASGSSTPVANSVAPTSNSQLLVQENDDHAPATAVDFDFPVYEETEVLGAPELTLTVRPVGTETRLFTKIYHVTDDGAELVGNQAAPVLVEGPDRQQVTVESAAFHRRFEPGDALRLTVATTDAAFYESRESAGARIFHADDAPTELAVPTTGNGSGLSFDLSVERDDGGDVFLSDATNRVDITVDADRPVRVRDRTPDGWTVVDGDPYRRSADGDYVVFRPKVREGTLTYFAKSPSTANSSGPDEFGPVEVSLDGGDTWLTVAGTGDTNLVVGTDDEL